MSTTVHMTQTQLQSTVGRAHSPTARHPQLPSGFRTSAPGPGNEASPALPACAPRKATTTGGLRHWPEAAVAMTMSVGPLRPAPAAPALPPPASLPLGAEDANERPVLAAVVAR
jgi:hypothetical protein